MAALFPRPLAVDRMETVLNWGDSRIPQRVWDKILPCPMSGCWIWTACVNPEGYGRLSWLGIPSFSHRVLYEAIGSIPDGLELDHKCRVRCCCNPQHLEPVTRKTNVARGLRFRAKLQCKRGHAYKGNTTLIQGSNGSYRLCTTCKRDRQRRWKKEQRRDLPTE